MKKNVKRIFSILLVVIMTFSATSASVAFAADAEDTVETVVTSDVMSVEGYEVEETYEEEIECEVQEFVEGDDTSVELSEDDVIESMNLTNGVSDLDLGITEDYVSDPVDTGENIEINTEPFEDNPGELIEVPAYSEDDVQTDLTLAYFKASPDELTIDEGGSSEVTLTYYGFSSGLLVDFSKNNSNVSAKITSIVKNKIKMTIVANRAGEAVVTVTLYKKNGEFFKDEKIYVTVRKTNYISIQNTRVDVLAGKSATVGFNLHGGANYYHDQSGAKCSYSIQENKWLGSAWTGYKYKINITGTNVGTTKIAIYLKNKNGNVLDKKIVTVNVSKNATVTPSSSKVSVDIGASKTISFTNKNAYGSLKYNCSLSNANCVTSWNGNNLTITGKKAGTTTITVRLSDSRGNLLASTTVTVTVKRNPKLTPSASTVNIIPAQKSKVNIKMSGYDGGVYAKYSRSNSSVCGLSWSGSWSNNSITMTAYGYKQGSTTITIYLYDLSGTLLTSTTVTVKVTGVPSITTKSSFNVNMGTQELFVVSVSNIASNYTLYFSKHGTSFESNWTKRGNTYYCSIKGTKEGTGNITLYLKSEEGVVLATKVIPVKIVWVDNPQIIVSNNTLKFTERGSGSLLLTGTGTKKDFVFRVNHSGQIGDPAINYSLDTTRASTVTLAVRCNSIYNTFLTINMIEKSTGNVLTSKKITINVVADTSQITGILYSFPNASSTINKDTFYSVFGENTKAKECWKKFKNAGGVCHGMATGAMLMKFNSGITPALFGKSSLRSLSKLSFSPTLLMNMKRFIDIMYISQFSSYYLNNVRTGLNALCNTVAAGNIVQVKISGPWKDGTSAHAVVAYKLDKVNNLLYVADSNYPNSNEYIRAISLTGSFGNYTGWSYNINSNTEWNNKNAPEVIKFQTYNSIYNQVKNLGDLTASPESYASDTNIMFTTSSNFQILDVEENVIATFNNGEFFSEQEDIQYVIPCNVNLNDDIGESVTYNTFSMPTSFYIIKNLEEENSEFEVEMINTDFGVKVSSESELIAFGVDDSCDLCMTSITLEKGESYDVTLLSSREGEGDIHVEGIATAESVDLGFAMVEGKLAETNSDGATVNLNGTADNYYEIEASATEGGSISPAGTSNVVRGSDLTYSIVADEGYFISEVLVNGIPVGAVDEYTFYSVDENSTIEARFEKSDLTVTEVDVKKDGYNVVSWNPARTSNGYEVYRKHLSGDWQKIADIESDVLDFVDEEITSKFYEYSYSVKAYSFDDSGEKIYGSFDTIGSKLDSSDVNLSVSKTPTKTTYIVGDNFDASGMELLLNYNDGTADVVTDGFTVTGFDSSEKGEKIFTVMYEGFTTTFEVSVIGKADFSKIDTLLDTIRNLDSQHYTNYDEVYATYIGPFEDTLELAKAEYLSENEQAEIDALYEELVGYYNLLEIAEEYRPYFEVAGGATVLTQGGVNYIAGLQPSLTKAKFQSTYADFENVTLEYNMTTARYMGTGSTVTVKSALTGEVIAEYVIVIYGDVDGTATINGRDAAAVSNSITSVADSLTGAAKLAANVEGTRATINAKDASVIRAVAGGSMTIDQATGKGVAI